MHRESIQRYLMEKRRAMVMASLKVLGRSAMGKPRRKLLTVELRRTTVGFWAHL
jgi:hypothetical protein